jgi:hypothetical protein
LSPSTVKVHVWHYLAISNVDDSSCRLAGAGASRITADGVTPRGEAVITVSEGSHPGGVHPLLSIHFTDVGVHLLSLLDRPAHAELVALLTYPLM